MRKIRHKISCVVDFSLNFSRRLYGQDARVT